MANDEVLGPRKTMFVLVIVVGCFAVLWPRILSPLLLGHTREQLKPNQFDRDSGCCEVLFDTELAVLELVNEVCSSAIGNDGKLSAHAAAECRRSVNETCGVDIVAFLKRDENVGKTTKKLLHAMKSSNSSCLEEHFGVPTWSLYKHVAQNSWTQQDTLKQERPLRGAGPHPALRERGRAIPAGAPTPPSRGPVPLPPSVRVRSPLSVYYEHEAQPPPIPGMRPPLGSPGGPVPAPKSSMSFVMPIYTICIIVFFVYTLSKILFKRTGSPYEDISPSPQFRRRVFRDDSRSSPETKLVVTAISGLVAEVQQQMEANYEQNRQRQDAQDNHTRPYTNGTVLNNAPIKIIASEYQDIKEESPEPAEKEPTPETKQPSPEPEVPTPETKDPVPEPKEPTPEPREPSPEDKEPTPEDKEPTPELKVSSPEPDESPEEIEPSPEKEIALEKKDANGDLHKLTDDNLATKDDSLTKSSTDFLNDERETLEAEALKGSTEEKQTTPELLEEALKEGSSEGDDEEEEEEDEEIEEPEKSRVKVMGMEVTAHAADGSAFPSEAPPPAPARPPLVVSGKMTLSLIQDAPRDSPDRDLESTMDDFTTASATTQPAAEKDEVSSEEELEEEIEVEEIEEEVEEEEEEEVKDKTGDKK